MWRTRDIMRDVDLTVWQQIKLNLAVWFWWRPLGKLARWGFLTTPTGYVLRLRDFTPFFWQTLVSREINKCTVKLITMEHSMVEQIHKARIEAVEDFVEKVISGKYRGL